MLRTIADHGRAARGKAPYDPQEHTNTRRIKDVMEGLKVMVFGAAENTKDDKQTTDEAVAA